MDISALSDAILVDVPGCLPATIETKLLETAIEFCAYTGIWSTELAAVSPVEDQRSYDLSGLLPADSRVVEIKRVKQADLPLTPLTAPSLDTTQANIASHYFPDKNSIQLWPLPSEFAEDDFYATVSLKPTQDAATLDDDLWEDWQAAITHGTKARLYAMPGQPWSDPVQASYHTGRYLDKRGEAKVAAFKEGSPADITHQPIEFGY